MKEKIKIWLNEGENEDYHQPNQTHPVIVFLLTKHALYTNLYVDVNT